MAEVQGGATVKFDGEIAAEGGEPAAVGNVHFADGCSQGDRGVGGHFDYRGLRIIVRRQLDLVQRRNTAHGTALDDDRRIGRAVRAVHDQRTVAAAVQADDDVEVAGECCACGYSTALEVPLFDGGQRTGQCSACEGKVIDILTRTHSLG